MKFTANFHRAQKGVQEGVQHSAQHSIGAKHVAMAFCVALSLTLVGCKALGGGDDDKPKVTPTVGVRTNVLTNTETSAQVDPALAQNAVIVPPAVRNTEWTQSGGNASKNIGHVALGESPQRVWTAKISGSSTRARLATPPVVSNGRLYVVDTDAEVRALDLATGKQIWTVPFTVKGDGRPSVFGGGVSVAGGRLYVTNGVGEVAAMNASDGEILWRVKPAGPLRGAPTLAFNSVYVMTQDNQLFALNEQNGEVLWSEAASNRQAGVFGVAAPAAGQATIIAGFSSGELSAYRFENGTNVWSDALARTRISTAVATLSDIDADPIIDQGRVYALGEGGRMAAYQLVVGQRIWEINIAGTSTPALGGEWLFTLTDDAKLLCIARSTGKVRWIADLQRWKVPKKKKGPIRWTGPLLAGNRLIVASSEGAISAVSPADGGISELFEVNASVTVPPIAVDGTLIILDDGGTITAYR